MIVEQNNVLKEADVHIHRTRTHERIPAGVAESSGRVCLECRCVEVLGDQLLSGAARIQLRGSDSVRASESQARQGIVAAAQDIKTASPRKPPQPSACHTAPD